MRVLRVGAESRLVAASRSARHNPHMAIKFNGSIDELKGRLAPLDDDGDWEAQPNSVWKYRSKDRAGMLWSETQGTVWFDGPGPAKANLQGECARLQTQG